MCHLVCVSLSLTLCLSCCPGTPTEAPAPQEAAATTAAASTASAPTEAVEAPKKTGGFWGYMRSGQKEAEEAERLKMEEWNRVAAEKAEQAARQPTP